MEWFLTLSIIAVFAGAGAAYGLVLGQQRVGQVYGELDSAWLKVSRQNCIIDKQARTIDKLLQRPEGIAAQDRGITKTAPRKAGGR